jgi:uncharacterized protein
MLRTNHPVIIACFAVATAFAQDKPAPAAPAAPTPPAAPATPAVKPPPEALVKAQEAAKKGDFATARKLLESEAEKGSGEAANAIGELMMGGQLGKATPLDAQKWFQKSADAGFPNGHMNLARLLSVGIEGLPKDLEKARFHLQAAADGGLPMAMTQLAMLVEKNIDLKSRDPNWKEPRDLYEKAAAAGDVDAAIQLTRFLDQGLGGPRDPARAMDYIFAAASKGSVLAMNEVGVRYQKGLGVRQDNVAAVGWFALAAQHGLPGAMVNLGNCYERGNGALPDLKKAGEWYAMAAKQNHPVAQFLLGQMFEEGRGTDINLAFAVVNYARAAAGGVKEAEAKREAVRKRLTPAQLKEAEKLLAPKTEEAPKDASKKKPAGR